MLETQEITRYVKLSDDCWASISPLAINDKGKQEVSKYLDSNRMVCTVAPFVEDDGYWVDIETTRDGVVSVCFSPFMNNNGVSVQKRYDNKSFRGRKPLQPINFQNYDWTKFIRLINDLETKLPFIGMKYLATKVLGTRNCGYGHPSHRRDIIRKARELGIIDVSPTPNVDGKTDPVNAVKLNRTNSIVTHVLSSTAAE